MKPKTPGFRKLTLSSQPLTVSAIKDYLTGIFKSKYPDLVLKPDGYISPEEAHALFGYDPQWYAASTGLYYIGNRRAITGIGGWELYNQQLKNVANGFLDDNKV